MNTEQLFAYENGGLTMAEAVVLFTQLVETGEIWKLPTEYLDDAAKLIDLGHVPTTKGTLQ
jgi:hypothetical protein